MTIFLKTFRLHNSFSHMAWATLDDKEGSPINVSGFCLESEVPLESFLISHSNDTIITFDGEYLFGRYPHIINPASVIGLDIVFYLTEMQKFSIGNFQYGFGDHGLNLDALFDHRSVSPQEFLDSSQIVKYLNQYCKLAMVFMQKNEILIDSFLSDARLMEFYTTVQPKICENVYAFNQNRIAFETSNKYTKKLMKDFGEYIIKIRRHGSFIYPNYYALSVVTGRLGFFGELNPMVLPKEIRGLIKPNNDAIISFDAKNAEPRMVFELSDTPLEHEDVYKGIVEVMGADSIDRDRAKSLWFSFVYGNKKAKQSSDVKKMKDAFPDIASFIGKLVERASRELIMHSFFGRRIPKIDGDDYKIVNYYIQSTFSDYFQLIIHRLMKKMSEQSLKSKVLCTIQDEFLLDMSAEEAENVASLIHQSVKEISEVYGFSDDVIQFDSTIRRID